MNNSLHTSQYYISHITDHALPIADRDTRESQVKEMVKELKEFCVEVYGYDPLLSKEEIAGFGVKALDNLDMKIKMDGVIVAVAHDEFLKKTLEDLARITKDEPVLIDARSMFDEEEAKRKAFYYMGL
jgi:UDPglucose 6-dehydrogenase/UDP-N-acetyl-D-galactosamine dehydrogenase